MEEAAQRLRDSGHTVFPQMETAEETYLAFAIKRFLDSGGTVQRIDEITAIVLDAKH